MSKKQAKIESLGNKQISYVNEYIWNLEKLYRWSYLQNRNRDTDIENKYMGTKRGKEGWDELRDWDQHIYTIDIYIIVY